LLRRQRLRERGGGHEAGGRGEDGGDGAGADHAGLSDRVTWRLPYRSAADIPAGRKGKERGMTMTTRAYRGLSIAALAGSLALVACAAPGAPGNGAATPTPTPTAMASVESAKSVAAPTPAASPVTRAEKTDLIDYSATYPAPAAAIPALKALLDKRAGDARAKALADAREDQQAAAKDGFPFHAHYYHADWAVAADTPRFLSLVGTIATYTGGAHGMTVFEPLLWDKQAGKAVAVGDLFTSVPALETALRSRFCAALDRERSRRRGEPVKHDDDPFDACIDPAEEAIVPTASGAGAIDGFTVYVAPYDAGPYAEGDYRIAVPVDAGMLGAIKPGYRGAFAAR